MLRRIPPSPLDVATAQTVVTTIKDFSSTIVAAVLGAGNLHYDYGAVPWPNSRLIGVAVPLFLRNGTTGGFTATVAVDFEVARKKAECARTHIGTLREPLGDKSAPNKLRSLDNLHNGAVGCPGDPAFATFVLSLGWVLASTHRRGIPSRLRQDELFVGRPLVRDGWPHNLLIVGGSADYEQLLECADRGVVRFTELTRPANTRAPRQEQQVLVS